MVPPLPASGAVLPAPAPWAPVPLLASSVLLTSLLQFLLKHSSRPHFSAISQCAVTCLTGKKAGRQSHPQLELGIVLTRVACSETFATSLGRSLPGMIKAGVEEEEPLLWTGRGEEDLLSHNFPSLRTCIFGPNSCGLEPKEGKKGPKKRQKAMN